MPLILRRANVSRKGGPWPHDDFDVFDGERQIGRVYLVDSYGGKETWFWGVSFQLTGKKDCGQLSMRGLGRLLSCKVQCASVGSFLI